MERDQKTVWSVAFTACLSRHHTNTKDDALNTADDPTACTLTVPPSVSPSSSSSDINTSAVSRSPVAATCVTLGSIIAISYYYLPPKGVRSIAMSMSDCLSVCFLSSRKPHGRASPNFIRYLWPWLGPSFNQSIHPSIHPSIN